MQTYHVETTIVKEGILSIEGLPLHKGEKVEVIVKSHLPISDEMKTPPYSLRGQPISYQEPFASVAENEWDVLNDPS